jgi:hypothetical protein
MGRRLQSLERRLTRLARIVDGWREELEHQRDLQAGRKVIAALIRAGLERAGLDPAEAVTLRRYEALEPLPPPRPPLLRRVDPRQVFVEKMRALAERMRGDPPSLSDASPAELFAYYCLGDGAKAAPA